MGETRSRACSVFDAARAAAEAGLRSFSAWPHSAAGSEEPDFLSSDGGVGQVQAAGGLQITPPPHTHNPRPTAHMLEHATQPTDYSPARSRGCVLSVTCYLLRSRYPARRKTAPALSPCRAIAKAPATGRVPTWTAQTDRRVHVLSRGHRALLVPEAGVGEPAIKCGRFRRLILHGEARARFQGAAVVSRDAGHGGQHARQDVVAQVDGRSSGGRVDNAIDSTFLLIPPATSTYVGESMRMLPARPWYDAMCTVFAVRRQHTSMGPRSLGWKPKGRQRPPLQSPAPRSFCSRRRAS